MAEDSSGLWADRGKWGPSCNRDSVFECRACDYKELSEYESQLPSECPGCGSSDGNLLDKKKAWKKRQEREARKGALSKTSLMMWDLREILKECKVDPQGLRSIMDGLANLMEEAGDKEMASVFRKSSKAVV